MTISVELRNCNNVGNANLTLSEGETTVLFGMNGSGKSTLANAIMYASKGGEIPAEMTPYGFDTNPSVTGVPSGYNVLVFNEDYVEDTLFKADTELIANGYRIFIETPQYKKSVRETNELLAEAKRRLVSECGIDDLLGSIMGLLDCYGRSKDGYAANSALGKGIAKKGNLVANVPRQFIDFAPLVSSGFGRKWIQWHKNGAEFSGLGVCPYCGADFSEDGIALCESLQDTYGSKYLDNCYKVFGAFGKAKECLSEKAREQVDAALHGQLTDSGFGQEDIALFASIKNDAEALRSKLEAIRGIGFESLKGVRDKVSYLKSLRIKIDSIDKMDSIYVREFVERINSVIDGLLERQIELQQALGKQASALKRTISLSSDDINGFLEAAGFSYEVELETSDSMSCSVSLKPRGIKQKVVEPKKRLSYGERNALAIALFSAQVKSDSPSLVVFDDPISSFDQNKKYAIIQRLFSKKRGVCNDVTTLLLTHDVETLVMLQRIHRDRICRMSFRYARNQRGALVLTDVADGDIGSTIEKLKNIAQGNLTLSLRIAAARRVLELTEEKCFAWSVLSSLLHLRDEATIGLESDARCLAAAEWEEARKSLSRVGFLDFDYDSVRDGLTVESLLSAYSIAVLPIEKICIFRVLADVCPSEMKKAQDAAKVSDVVFEFADEFFHVENLLIFQLDLQKYDMVPNTIIEACDKTIASFKTQ